MRAVVVYESMFGNTRQVAESVGEGLRTVCETVILSVSAAEPSVVAEADLLVVGGPTHAHGMSRARTREMAVVMAEKPDSGVRLDDHARGPGLREWFFNLETGHGLAAAFDTRLPMAPLFTGRASKRIGRLLARHGYRRASAPQSFIVDKTNRLLPGELDRARAWGESLGASLTAAGASARGGAAGG